MTSTQEPCDSLWPPPRSLRRGPGIWQIPDSGHLHVSTRGTEDGRALRHLLEGLTSTGRSASHWSGDPKQAHLTLELESTGGPHESHRLHVTPLGVRLSAADDEGLFRAATTLLQLMPPTAQSIPCLELDDAPDFAVRGAMLDVSRDRVPTTERLEWLLDRLVDLKLNQLQLYVEHTFAFPGHEDVWRDASPFTPEQIRALDERCRERFVTLVPNLQSFGHMHRWLTHPAYTHLAECPEGVLHPFSQRPEPFSLCPTDRKSFELLGDLYDHYLPNFRARLFNVGCDETFDLGRGRSRAVCEERGTGRVYLDYMLEVFRLVRERGARPMFWADVILQYPELVSELPEDAVAVAWGYEAGHPFEDQAAQLAQAGLDFYLCPGTSSWQSLVGRVPNMRANLAETAAAGLRHGATGLLITDWGDFGHWQPPCTAWPGWVAGAGHAWRADADTRSLADRVDRCMSLDPDADIGQTLLDLGELERETGAQAVNGTSWFFILRYAHEPWPSSHVQGLTQEGLRRAEVRAVEISAGLIERAQCSERTALAREELRWATDLTAWACRLGRARVEAGEGRHLADLPAGVRASLVRDLSPLLERMRELWLRGSRPGGLTDSVGRLEDLARLMSQ